MWGTERARLSIGSPLEQEGMLFSATFNMGGLLFFSPKGGSRWASRRSISATTCGMNPLLFPGTWQNFVDYTSGKGSRASGMPPTERGRRARRNGPFGFQIGEIECFVGSTSGEFIRHNRAS